MSWIFRPLELLKASAKDLNAITTHKDGSKWKKVGQGKWVRVAKNKSFKAQKADQWRKAQQHFDYAMASELGNILDETLVAHGITSFDQLVDTITESRRELSGEIYKDVLTKLRESPGPLGWKKDLADNVGRALIILRDNYTTEQKVKLTVKRKAPSGREYNFNEGKQKVTKELPTLKPTVIAAAKKKVGGWSVTGNLTTGAVNKMLANGTARLIEGEIQTRKPWTLPVKAEDMSMTYTGDSLKIKAKQVQPGKQRSKTLSRVEIDLPYAYAKAFLINQVSSVRTRNNFIFRMERSAGYRKFLKESQ